MKKFLKIGFSYLFVFVLLSGCSKTLKCGEAGTAVPTMAKNCCDGLSEMWSTCAENDCGCEHSFPIVGGLEICSNCGNEICERKNNENHCNCPQDCEILEKKEQKCGNNLCESAYNENNYVCPEDCPTPIFGSKNLHERDNLQNYYEIFREKCENDKCCLSSFETAKKLRSEIFFNNDGLMNMDADCPSGYRLNMNRCATSYVWCEKN